MTIIIIFNYLRAEGPSCIAQVKSRAAVKYYGLLIQSVIHCLPQ